ncbi:MAG TPA: CRISPR-associated RAMP protein Csx10 [Anaerolineae bacterium]|nr:CRISPR-associated RAMP protein Csx10 [Anaerolineae bacterium]
MKKLRIVITARSPLAISARKPGGQFRESLGYIPGALLRGAAAQVMLKAEADHVHCDPGAPADCPFCRIFCSDDPALFANAYPGPTTALVRVIPATAVSCKGHPGFLREPEQRCRLREERLPHGVFDTLIDRLCWEALQSRGLVYALSCPACDGRLERFGGFYYVEDGKYRHSSIPQRLLTRVALNRRRGVAEDQLLYSPSVLAEARRGRPTTFVGEVYVDGVAEELEKALRQVRYLGGGSSRGLGRVEVEARLVKGGGGSVANRVEAFNEAVRGRWEPYKKLAPRNPQPKHNPDDGAFFTIGLMADAILRDGWRPTMVLTAEMLKEATGIADDSLVLVRSYAGYGYRGGWNAVWELPKVTEVIASMGSVYVYWTADIDKWLPALAKLEVHGVGERRAEGFGRVRVCDEFHLIRREEPK